jgi:DNA-binding response OmpR family regulator
MGYFIEHPSKPVHVDTLAKIIGASHDAARKQIEKLRKLIEEDPKDPQLLLTLRGEGYLLYAVPDAVPVKKE